MASVRSFTSSELFSAAPELSLARQFSARTRRRYSPGSVNSAAVVASSAPSVRRIALGSKVTSAADPDA